MGALHAGTPSPKPAPVSDAAEARAFVEYTAFADLSADTTGETASIWMRRVYLVQENAGGWHLMVEHDRFPLTSVHDVRARVESARHAGEALGKSFVDASIGFFSAKITDVFSEAFDARGNEPERWFTRDPLGLGALAGGISAADHDLHRAVGMPLEHLAGASGMNGATQGMAAGIAGNMLLAPVDRQLAGVVRKVEIVGIAVGVAFGMHPLALACTKLFLRAQLNREIGNAMKEALFGRNVVQGQEVVEEPTRPVDRSRPVEPVGPGVDRVQLEPIVEVGWEVHDRRHRELVERLGIGRTVVPPRSRAAVENLEPGAVSEPYAISGPEINRGIGMPPPF